MNDEEYLDQVFEEGYAACLDKKEFNSNPYNADSAEHSEWDSGWVSANDDESRRPQ